MLCFLLFWLLLKFMFPVLFLCRFVLFIFSVIFSSWYFSSLLSVSWMILNKMLTVNLVNCWSHLVWGEWHCEWGIVQSKPLAFVPFLLSITRQRYSIHFCCILLKYADTVFSIMSMSYINFLKDTSSRNFFIMQYQYNIQL